VVGHLLGYASGRANGYLYSDADDGNLDLTEPAEREHRLAALVAMFREAVLSWFSEASTPELLVASRAGDYTNDSVVETGIAAAGLLVLTTALSIGVGCTRGHGAGRSPHPLSYRPRHDGRPLEQRPVGTESTAEPTLVARPARPARVTNEARPARAGGGEPGLADQPREVEVRAAVRPEIEQSGRAASGSAIPERSDGPCPNDRPPVEMVSSVTRA
jgi:hypothetical protein